SRAEAPRVRRGRRDGAVAGRPGGANGPRRPQDGRAVARRRRRVARYLAAGRRVVHSYTVKQGAGAPDPSGGEGNRTPTLAVQRPRAPIITTPPGDPSP